MTACFKLMKALQPNTKHPDSSLCEPCVYFSRNLDPANLGPDAAGMKNQNDCGLGFTPGDAGCTEMRTNNCSARKGKS